MGEAFLLPGPVGVLEALLEGNAGNLEKGPIGIVCHPNPLFGGNMTNKVVHMVAKAFNELGVPALRFNFRGVGESQGVHDHGQGEVEDLLAVVDWLRQRHPKASFWLAGFSFGAYVAFQAQARAKFDRLLLVAPPVSMYHFPEIEVDIPWLVIQGSADEVIDPKAVSAWASQQLKTPEYCWMEGVSHFFHGKLVELRALIRDAWGRK